MRLAVWSVGAVMISVGMGSAGAQDGAPEFHVAWADASPSSAIDDESPWWGAHRFRYGPALYETEFRALWNAAGLYVRFDATDTNPWHTMTERDDPIWEEEVVEIFLDLDRSGTNYAEVEINPNNVVTDLRMVRGVPDQEGGPGLESRGTREPRSAEQVSRRLDRRVDGGGLSAVDWLSVTAVRGVDRIAADAG